MGSGGERGVQGSVRGRVKCGIEGEVWNRG